MEEPVSTSWCPLGDGRLVLSMANGRHESCDGCHGFAVTVWLLEELLVEGAGSTIWRAAADAPLDGHPCPHCRARMARVPAAPTGAGAEVEVCHPCELVWVSAEAQQILPGRPELAGLAPLAASGGLGSPDPTQCPTCGAPYTTTEDGRCHHCRAVVRRVTLAVAAPYLAEAETDERLEARAWRGPTADVLDAMADRPTF